MKWFFKFVLIFCCCILTILLPFVGIIKFEYPIAYSFEIEKFSKEYGLDACLVRAIIKQESGYNYLATSDKGAMGLMQIMPNTARWLAYQNDIEYKSDEVLYNPSLNIELGCIYLKYLFDKYEIEEEVLFAYNAGEGRLQKIKEATGYLDVDTIEINETRDFIYNVLKHKNVYYCIKKYFYV